MRIGGWVWCALWLVALVLFSWELYVRFSLSEDFGVYNQAWTLIGQGHLNPYETIYSLPFIKANLELIVWPLALLHVVFPQPIVLLWVQDACVAGTGLVAYLWIVDVLEGSLAATWVTGLIPIVALLVIVANPGVYQTVGFDVHMEPISALFLVLAGRDLWRGRERRGCLFALLVLICGAFAAIELVGLGISALLAGPRSRRSGLLLIALGAGWWVLALLLHVNPGGLSQYAYLSGRSSLAGIGGVAILLGAAAHPARVVHQLHTRLADIWTLLRPAGAIGVASAWGFGVPVVVLLANALNSQRLFITEPFQSSAVFPFVLVGTVMVLLWAASHRHTAIVVVLASVLIAGQALCVGIRDSPWDIRWFLDQRVGAAQAAELQMVLNKVPPTAEVIATSSIMGRFCAREACRIFVPYVPQQLESRDVVFIFATGSSEGISPGLNRASIAYVRDRLQARVLVDARGITALEWRHPPQVALVTVPSPAPSSNHSSS
jgi:hypothetical protein